MPYEYFCIMARNGEGAAAFNDFLAGQRVLRVRQRFVDAGGASYWAVCVEYLPGPPTGAPPESADRRREPVDYRQRLTSEEYEVFDRLRALRNQWASEESIRPYLIFTNEQLFQIVKRRVGQRSQLEQIAGVGAARVAKYGERVLEALGSFSGVAHETPVERVSADLPSRQSETGGVEGAAGTPEKPPGATVPRPA